MRNDSIQESERKRTEQSFNFEASAIQVCAATEENVINSLLQAYWAFAHTKLRKRSNLLSKSGKPEHWNWNCKSVTSWVQITIQYIYSTLE